MKKHKNVVEWQSSLEEGRKKQLKEIEEQCQFEQDMLELLPKDVKLSRISKGGPHCDATLSVKLDFSHYSTRDWPEGEREAFLEGDSEAIGKRVSEWGAGYAELFPPSPVEIVKAACTSFHACTRPDPDKDRDYATLTPIHPVWIRVAGYTHGSTQWEWGWYTQVGDYLVRFSAEIENIPQGLGQYTYDRKAQNGSYVVSNSRLSYPFVDPQHIKWGAGSSDALNGVTFYWLPDAPADIAFQRAGTEERYNQQVTLQR